MFNNSSLYDDYHILIPWFVALRRRQGLSIDEISDCAAVMGRLSVATKVEKMEK
jgi:hypothetical protein